MEINIKIKREKYDEKKIEKLLQAIRQALPDISWGSSEDADKFEVTLK